VLTWANILVDPILFASNDLDESVRCDIMDSYNCSSNRTCLINIIMFSGVSEQAEALGAITL
jgi:hypothetical protein